MKLYYDRNQNFGDELNAWLWPRLIPEILDEDERAIFVGIGSLLNSNLPAAPFKVVFGAGVALNRRGVEYGKRLPVIDERWRVYGVRGPLSAKALGLPADRAITDGAALLRVIDLPHEPKVHRASFIPHCVSKRQWPWREICRQAGVHFIDPNDPVDDVLRELRRSEVVITEAMHGAIMADALRVPWIPVRAYANILTFKWQDWCRSLGLEYRPVALPALYTPEQVAWRVGSYLERLRVRHTPVAELYLGAVRASVRRATGSFVSSLADQATQRLATMADSEPWALSDDRTLDRAVGRLEAQLGRLRADYASGLLEELARGAGAPALRPAYA
jgi:succinoglycan biosynthesis protein ExoV